MAHDQVLLDTFAAKVEITVLEAQVLSDFGELVKHEGRCLGRVENADFTDLDFDFTGRHLRVDGAFRTRRDFTDRGHHKLVANRFCLGVCFWITIGVEGQLTDAGTVTKIDKDQTSMVTPTVNPTHHADFFANIFFAQFAAVMSSFPVSEYIAQGANSLK